jgi:hypothetical protein
MRDRIDASDREDIKKIYEGVGIAESFRFFEEDGLTYMDVEAALGSSVAEQYATWLFFRKIEA